MPTYRFQSEELGVDYNIDFENVPTKKDFYDVLKSQVDTKQVANLIDSPKGKALAVDAYRNGFFDENTPEVGWSDVGDIVMDMAESAWSGLGKIAVDRPVIKQRTQDLAVRLGGVEKNLAYGKTMQEYGIKDVKRDVDFDTSMKLDQAGVRLLDRATILDKERSDFGDGMDYVQQSLAYVGLDPNDKDLQAEVARRTFRFSEATDKASLYQGLIDNVAGYRMLGSLGKRELSQSDWFKSEQSDDDIVEEIRHLREMQVIGETLDRGAETMARVLGDTKTAQQIKKGLVSPDKDIALMTEMLFDPAEYIAPGVARTTQMTLRGLGTPGQIRRLANKQKEAIGIKKEAIKDLAKRQEVNSRSPDVSKEIQDASEEFFKKIIKDQNRVILETSKKLTGVLEKTGGPPSLQKGAGFVTRATGYGADLVGRTAEFIYSAPKELAVDLLVKSGMTTEGAESLLKWGTGIGAGVTGASLISNEEWKPEWTDALVGAGILLGPRALQAGGTTMRHLGDYWSQGAGTRNMFEYLQQMDVAPKLSGAIIDRTTDGRMLPGIQETSKVFTKGETPGITGNFNKRQALPSGVRSFARGMTATGADKVASFAGRTGIAGATAMALPGAIGYATGGIEGMAGSIGASLPFIGIGLGSGELMRHKSKADLQIKQRGDVTAFRKNLDDMDGMLYDKLNFESQAGVASASIKYPDLEIGFYDAPGKANGFYDEPKVGNRSGKVMINVSGDAPLIGILSHEVGHHIMRHGMQPLIHEIFFGSVAKEKGGVFTAKDADGNPIIEYENGVPRYKLDEATFGKARDEYLSRLEDTQGVSEELRDQYTRNPEAILDEVVAEHVAHMLMKDKYGESILDKNVGDLAKSLFSAISGKGFIRDAGVGMGLASDEFGNGIFSAIEENSQLTKLVNDYNKLSERRSRQEMEDMIEESSSDVAVDATDLKSDAKLQDLFDGAIMRDDDGNIVRDVSGAPKLMTNGQMNKKQEQMSSDLSNLIDRMNDEDKADGHVIMRDTADGGRTGEGMFIDESIIDALAQGGNYSASQINFLRQASAVGRAISNGDITGNEVLMFYYPATRGGRKYKSLRGGFRSALIWGLQVSKAGNVNIQTLSLTGIEKNLSRMLKTKKYTKMLSEAFGAETNQGIRQAFNEKLGRYLENQHKGIENGKQGSGVSVEERNMINAMMGENVKMQGEVNPVFARLGFRPETTIRSRRIDRIGTIQTTGKGAPVTYNGIKRNLMPRKGKDSQGQQTMDFGGPRRVSDESVDVRKIARDIINKLKPQSPNNLANLADRLSDEYNVAPSLFEEALFKQYWNSKGFLMPRLNGLQDNIGQALAESKQDKMSSEQLMSLLEKKAGALPLAKDIGLDKWAKEKGKVTREEVANYIEKNKIVIEYDNRPRNYYGKMGQGRYITPGPHKGYNENFYRWKNGGFQGRREKPILKRAKEHILYYDDRLDAEEAVDYLTELFEQNDLIPGEDIYLYDRVPGRNIDATQMFDFFSSRRPGGKSGVRFQVARGGAERAIENLLEDDLVWTTEYMPNSGEIKPVGEVRENAPDQSVSDKNIDFVPSHDNWQGESNIVGHTRSTEREFIFDGKEYKSRHLEEVQSDTHQQGRREGYLPPEFSYKQGAKVPDYPLKKNWPSVLFKNEMLQAFDDGMDIISWADGSTHNKRYNLSDIVDSIEVSDYKGRFGVPYEDDLDIRVVDIRTENITGVMQLHVDPTGLIVRNVGQGDYKNKNLSEVIGKQMAKKIMGLDNTNLNPDSVHFPPGIDSAISELQENYFGDDFIVDGNADVKEYNEFRKKLVKKAELEISKMFGSPEGKKKVIDKIMEANDKLLHSGKSKFSPLEVHLLGKPLSPATTPDGDMSAPKLPNEVRAKLNSLEQYKLKEMYQYSGAFTLDSPIGEWPGASPFLDHAFDLYFYMKKPYGSHIRRTMNNAKYEPTAFAFMNQHVHGFFDWLAGTREDLNSYDNYSDSNYAEWPHTTDRGVIGRFEGKGLSIEDPALVSFYDKELVALATKFAKKMGVPKPVRSSTNAFYNQITPENAEAKFNEFIEPVKAVNVDFKVYDTGADLGRDKVAEMFNANIDGDLEDFIYTNNGDRMYFTNLRTRVLHGKGYIKGTMRFFGKGKPFEMADLVHLMGKESHNFEFDKPTQVERFTKDDFKFESQAKKNSWAMALPKDRSKIENLGFYMPSLGKDDGNVPSTPLIVRDRANRYRNMSRSQLRKSATEAEQEWREVASPDEPKNYTTTDEESKYTQKRNEIVRKHKAINDALKFKSESTRLMPGKIKAPGTDEFKNWFKKSKVVYDNGTPMVVYHGSPWAKFNEFRGSDMGNRGNWFSEDIDYAKIYMDKELDRTKEELANGATLEDLDLSKEEYDSLVMDRGIYEIYLSMQNPLDISNINLSKEITLGEFRKKTGLFKDLKFNPIYSKSMPEFLFKDDYETYGWEHLELFFPQLEQELRDKGYDGLIAYETGRFEKAKTYMPLDATQIKSATDNKGTFDPTNPDIRMMPSISQENTESLRNFMSAKGKPEFAEKDGNNYFPKIFYHGGLVGTDGSWVFNKSGSNNGETFLSTDYVFAKGYTGGWENVGNQNDPHATNDALQLITNVSNVFDSTNLDHGRKLRDAIVKDKGKRFMRNIDKYGDIRDHDFKLRDDTLAEIKNNIFYFSPGQGQVPSDKSIVPYTLSDSEGNFDTYENWEVMEDYAKYIKDMGHDAYTIYEDDNSGIVKNLAVFNSRDIKLIEPTKNFSGAKPFGSFDPTNSDIRYMPLLNLPGTNKVQYKDNSNLIPIVFKNLSAYSGKHVTFVEADRHDTDGVRMGGPLHAFLKSNNIIISHDGADFRPQWANLSWKVIRGMIERVKMTDDGMALISVMHEKAHRSNKDMFSRTAGAIENNRGNMNQQEIEVVGNIMAVAILRGNTKLDNPSKSQLNFVSAFGSYKTQVTKGNISNATDLWKKMYKTYSKTDWWNSQLSSDLISDFRKAIPLGATFKARADISSTFMRSKPESSLLPFLPDIDALLESEMDYPGAKIKDVIGAVQLSKHKLDSPERIFGVYLGNDPEEISFMTDNEKQVLKKFKADPKFRVHPSYDWLMLGPGNADFFMLDKPVDPVDIMTDDFIYTHEQNWKNKVAQMQANLMKRFGRDKVKRGDSDRAKSSFKKYEKEKAKTPLPQQSKSNILGAFLRYESETPKLK